MTVTASRRAKRQLDADDDFASCVLFLEVTNRVGYIAQRDRSVDDRFDLAGLEQLFEGDEVVLRCDRHEIAHPPTARQRYEGAEQHRLQDLDSAAAGHDVGP